MSKIGKSERTRAAILNSALDFIWSHPFRDMTVSSLMASTGMGRSAFYKYFKDLHELMEALLESLTRVWVATLYGSEWLGSGASDLVRK